jgi:hypothetical protein
MVLLVDEAQVDARLVCLEIVLILTQDRSTLFADCTIGLEITLDAPSGTPRLRGSCGISLRSWRKIVHGLHQMYHKTQKSFWTHHHATPGWRGSCRILLRSIWTVLVLLQDRCTVYTKRTLDSEIILDAPDGTPRWWISIESLSGSFWR